MNTAQQELLAEIQRLAIAGSIQTGKRIYHEVIAWGDGAIWSVVRSVDHKSEPLHGSKSVVDEDGDDCNPDLADYCTLYEQRDMLAQWIVENRVKEGV